MKMLKTLVLMTVAIAFAAGCGGSTKSGKVLVEINGDKITDGDLELMGEINPRIQRLLESPDGKQRILDNLIEQELLYQEGIKEGLNRDPEVQAKFDFYRRVIIGQALIDEQIDRLAKEHYEKHPIEFEKIGLSLIQIMFDTPEEIRKAARKGIKIHPEEEALSIAKEVKTKIDDGMSFEEAAKKYSEEAPMGNLGGDIGLVSLTDMMMNARGLKPVLEKAFKMNVGEIAGPIRGKFGYYIITVTRGVELQSFEAAKPSIFTRLKSSTRKRLIAEMKRNAKIVYTEEGKQKEAVGTEAGVKETAEKEAKAPAETTEKK